MGHPKGADVDRQAVKPPFAYYGGKTTLAPKIASLLPPHEHYVEPFAGSLAVLLAKKPSRAETVNDLDGDLMTFWRVLRDRPDDLERVCALTPHSRAEFDASADLTECDDLERARRVYVRLNQSRSHSMKATGWRTIKNATGRHTIVDHMRSYERRIPAAAERLRDVTLDARDALDVIRDYGTEPTVCIYADPPYVGSTRATNYGHEMTDDDQHEAFAQACHDAKASVVISGYDSPLYDRLFDGWHRYELKAPTTLSGDTDRVEVLWSNRPLAGSQSSLFDLEGLA
jgi:DNA adenine methylase